MKPVWLGALSPGGLALPAANPTRSQMYAPRGVFLHDDGLIVADSGNHRVLLWRGGVPDADGAEADVVLGQPDFVSEGAKLLHLPTGVLVHEGKLLVADAWHHRVLVWNEIPHENRAPDYAIGQRDLVATAVNRGEEAASATSLYWPYGIGCAAGWFWIADTGNRRVLGWPRVPRSGDEPAQVILGQDTPQGVEENRGGAISAKSFRWPHAIAGDAERLFVADAGNHRVLGWSPAPQADGEANIVLGQPGFTTATELPHVPQGPSKMRFPYGVTMEGERLAVADTANNRVLIWEDASRGAAADRVLGQDNFGAAGENRWKAVTHDSLCWPYAIHLHRGQLAVADSGNNRVTLWRL